MLLKDAIYQMTKANKFKAVTGICYHLNQWGQVTGEHGTILKLAKSNLDLEGEIIPAEPKVLTVEEIATKWLRKDEKSDATYYFDCTREAHKNGRLEMWLEVKNASAALKYYINNPSAWDRYSDNVSGQLHCVINAINELNPIKED